VPALTRMLKHGNPVRKSKKFRARLLFLLCIFIVISCHASKVPLTFTQISKLRVREIKRQLSRNHGYSADELSRMLDKKELIEALAFEEHKLDMKEKDELRRKNIQKAVLVAIVCVLVVMCWPLINHAFDVALVNIVVYTDKKKYEMSQCWSFKSLTACFGIICMATLDFFQVWLSCSVLLSWVISRNKYFFPTPSIPISPSLFMHGAPGGRGTSPLDRIGINVGPMMITWLLRWLRNRTELFVGKSLLKAQKKQRKAERKKKETETADLDRKLRRARRRAEKEARKARIKKRSSVCTLEPVEEIDEAVNDNEIGEDAFPFNIDASKNEISATTPFDDLD